MQVIISLIIALFSVYAIAQTDGETAMPIDAATPETQEDFEAVNSAEADAFAENTELEMIEVTGSYIKRVDEQGTSPVTVVSDKEAKATGRNSMADVFRESALTNQDTREDSLQGNPGAATAGIGIFDSSRILVLLDGQRLPKMGGSNSVDLNLIPMTAIERVEVLKDGASATYGSDAIGGVMNFITKKNFSGGTVSIRQTSAERGGASQGDVALSFGKTYKKSSFLVAVERKDNSHLADRDRDFSRMSNIAQQGSPSSNYGTVLDLNTGGGITTNPNCPAGNLDAAGICRYDYTTQSWNLPDNEQYSALLTGSYKFNKYLQTRTTTNLVHRKVNTQLAPPPDTVRLTGAQAEQIIPGFTAAGAGDAPVLLFYRLEEAGPRRGEDETNMFNVSQKFYGKVAGTWTWDLTGSFGKSIRRNTGQGYADRRVVVQKMLDKEYLPFAPQGQKGNLNGAFFTTHEGERSEQGTAKFVTTGALYNGGDIVGPIAMAVGGSLNWQSYSTDVDVITSSGNNWGGIGSNGIGTRNYQSLFQELSIFPTDSLEIGLAARFDSYSDFGDAVTPKISASWRATDNFMFRTSLGTGFRAPNLANLYGGRAISYPTFVDAVGEEFYGIPGAGSAQQYQMNTFANPNLQEEQSVFFNLGFVAQPKKNWSIETNFFYAKIKDGVGSPNNGFLIQTEQDQIQQAVDNGASLEQAQQIANAYMQDNFQTTIERGPDGRLISLNRPSAYNVSRNRLQGIDFVISNEARANLLGLPVGIYTRIEHMQFLRSENEPFPGLGMQGQRNIDWKNMISVTGVHRAHSFRIAARTTSGGDTNDSRFVEPGQGSLPTYTAYDLNYTYGKLFGGALTLGIKNVLDEDPPLDFTVQSPGARLDLTTYDIPGRVFFANFDYAF